jgi:BolA protein
MQERLAALTPESLEIQDESAAHAGHAGAQGGGGHYWLMIVSSQFVGKLTVARHRMIYDALKDMMQTEIHALSIQAYSPDEV